MKKLFLYICLFLFAFCTVLPAQADPEKKVILQAFWWDYWNSNFPNSYANYLTELAPRLKDLGINAVWVPPFQKNPGTNSVGYSPFDQYDLGDKCQKNTTTTRFGTKDELLRMIAVMHANGIEVIADVVLNHTDGAGGENGGAGGEDPDAWDNKWKNFRYVCYETPVVDGGLKDYSRRSGRWSKNWQNFHANPGHVDNGGDWCSQYWGPDHCFYEGAYGISSNITEYNPEQHPNYMRDHARDWLMWMKKQTAVDGFRWDAVKHYPEWAQQDFLYNVKYNLPDWAAGGEAMFSVGEFMGSKDQIDNYCKAVQYANGGNEFMMGAYDVQLRSAIKGIVDGNGYGNLWGIPGEQMNMRSVDYASMRVHRSMNFVNSHDTFRPQLDKDGRIVGWDSGNETGGHIDPNNERLGMAYAIAMALDGNICVYMEDLFDLNNGKRFTHMPSNPKDLPVRPEIQNLIWCHQNLNFKYGDYKVRWQDEDMLVIERSGNAIIAITDDGYNAHDEWIDTDFRNVVLKDYSGGTPEARKAWGDGRFNARVTPTGSGLGYAVWAPEGRGGYAPYRSKVTNQEWEMANDLGDSHCASLGQGGALPAQSTHQRLVGKIYPAQGTDLDIYLHPEKLGHEIVLGAYDLDGNLLAETTGTKDLHLNYTVEKTGWVAIKIRNAAVTNPEQKAWVRAQYTAPAKVKDTMEDKADTRASIWTGNEGNRYWDHCGNWEQGKIPTTGSKVIIPAYTPERPEFWGNLTISELVIEKGSGTFEENDLAVHGKLTVTGTTTCKEGTAYICGFGTADLGTIVGDVNTCDSPSTSVPENQAFAASISYSPNPVQDRLYVSMVQPYTGSLAIYNLSGQLCYQEELVEAETSIVEMQNLPSGVYILRMGSYAARIIKQ